MSEPEWKPWSPEDLKTEKRDPPVDPPTEEPHPLAEVEAFAAILLIVGGAAWLTHSGWSLIVGGAFMLFVIAAYAGRS